MDHETRGEIEKLHGRISDLSTRVTRLETTIPHLAESIDRVAAGVDKLNANVSRGLWIIGAIVIGAIVKFGMDGGFSIAAKAAGF